MCNNDISDEKFIGVLNEGLRKVDETLVAWKGEGIFLKRVPAANKEVKEILSNHKQAAKPNH